MERIKEWEFEGSEKKARGKDGVMSERKEKDL